MNQSFEPKLLTVVKEGLRLPVVGRDLIAGSIVAVVALPLSIALAIASGAKPEQGLATAVVAGFLISALGGSRVQIGGPTGAFIVVVSGIVGTHGYAGLAVATLMAGVLLILMGLARFGNVISFIPYPVVVGFTSGIACIIAVSQLRDFLGLTLTEVPAETLEKLGAYLDHAHTLNPAAAGLGVFTLALILGLPRLSKRIPAPLVAIVAATVLARVLDLPVETIGDRFGAIPTRLPAPSLPPFSRELVGACVGPAFTIALLAGIESLLSAVVADGMTGRRHRPNMELIAQGCANIASPLFGGIPATGAIARTATNIKNGGTTPLSGMWHAVLLLLIMLFLGKWVVYFPLTALAALLLVVAYNMSELHLVIAMFKSPRGDLLVLWLTLLLTVLVDLTVAIEVGVVLASLLFMRRMAALAQVTRLNDLPMAGDGQERPFPPVGPGVEIFEIMGPFFFGAAEKFQNALQTVGRTRVLILHMAQVPAIDATAIAALDNQLRRAAQAGMTVLLSAVQSEPYRVLKRSGTLARLGEAHVLPDLPAAVAYAHGLLPGTPAPD